MHHNNIVDCLVASIIHYHLNYKSEISLLQQSITAVIKKTLKINTSDSTTSCPKRRAI